MTTPKRNFPQQTAGSPRSHLVARKIKLPPSEAAYIKEQIREG